jgi:CubicO group peptidase (beta-lactamase class C family)
MAVVKGQCDTRFEPLRELFADHLDRGRDQGAAVAVTVGGRTVADLWGGHTDAARSREWESGTLVLIMSVTKGLTGICGNMCIERGLLDPDAPVARYWPEFAAAGKEELPVRYVFDHRAGLPDIPGFDPAELGDWNAVCAALAAQPPSWPPGTAHAYHALTYGWLVGELVRLVTGKRPGRLLNDEVCKPLGVEAYMGAPPEIDGRLADILPALVRPGIDRRAEIPASNGYSNARSLARIFAALACGGELDGVHVLDGETIADATSSVVTGPWHESMFSPVLAAIRFGRGFQLNSELMYMGPNPHAFGHSGGGGAMVWADPRNGVSFAYTPNLYDMDMTTMYDRANQLSRRVFDCLG